MSLTQDFLDNPLEFLEKHVVVVQDDSVGTPKLDPVDFFLRAANANEKENNYAFLVKRSAMNKSDVVIPAYWLPWNKREATTLTLGNTVKFMFTSEMTNCRFSVLTGDMRSPKVAHVDGSVESKLRDQYEESKGFPKKGTEEDKKMRRLSRTGIDDHGYLGNKGLNPNSAFVMGYRPEDNWEFYAQIVGGVMAGEGMNALKLAKKRVEPLKSHYKII